MPMGVLAGLVSEVDLLKHMLEGKHIHSADETIAEIVSPTQAIFPQQRPWMRLCPRLWMGRLPWLPMKTSPLAS